MRNIISLFFVFLIILKHHSQNTLKGNVIGMDGVLTDFNILLLHAKDSSLITGDQFLNGVFQLNNIYEKHLLVKIYSFEFSDTLFPVFLDTNVYDIGTIRLTKLKTVDDIVINGKKPVFERKDGNTIVNVENTMLGSTTSAMELLSKTPSVMVGDDMVSVFGRGEALIYLNGKQITMDRLASIPVSQIKKIEILSNPSAKYDAEGRAVINVITATNTSEGLKGKFTQVSTLGKYYFNMNTLDLNYKKKKISLFGNYVVILGTDWFKRTVDKNILSSTGTYISHKDYEFSAKTKNYSTYQLGFNYDINPESNFSLSYDGKYAKHDYDIVSNTIVVAPDGNTTGLAVFDDKISVMTNNSFSLNYNKTLDTLGSNLFIGGQYCDFQTNRSDLITEEISLNDSFLNKALRNNEGKNRIHLATAQLDYLKILKNSSQWEFGTKFSSVANDGSLTFKSKQDGSVVWVENPQYSNGFLYTEQVPAVYAQYAGKINKKWNVSLGGRTEFSRVTGFSSVLNKSIVDTSYINFFPASKVSYTKSGNLSFNLSFSSRINRPAYQTIDPYVWYSDSLNSTRGNPLLIPERNYSAELQTIYKKYSLKAGYTYTINPIKSLPIAGENGPSSVIVSSFNLKRLEQYNCSVEIPIEKKWYYSYTTISGIYQKAEAFELSVSNLQSSPQVYINSYSQFTLAKGYTADLSVEYISSYSDGVYKYFPQYYFTAGVSKYFLQKKLFVRLIVNDFLKTYYEANYSSIGNFETKIYDVLNTFFIRCMVAYKFGELTKSTYKNKTVNDNEYNRIKQ